MSVSSTAESEKKGGREREREEKRQTRMAGPFLWLPFFFLPPCPFSPSKPYAPPCILRRFLRSRSPPRQYLKIPSILKDIDSLCLESRRRCGFQEFPSSNFYDQMSPKRQPACLLSSRFDLRFTYYSLVKNVSHPCYDTTNIRESTSPYSPPLSPSFSSQLIARSDQRPKFFP